MSKAIEPKGELIYSYIPPGNFKPIDNIAKEYRVYRAKEACSGIVVYALWNNGWSPNPWSTRELIRHLIEALTLLKSEPTGEVADRLKNNFDDINTLYRNGCYGELYTRLLRAREIVEQLQAQLSTSKQEADVMWEGLNGSIAELQAEIAKLKANGNDVVCGDHWDGLSGEMIDGNTGCPWCIIEKLTGEKQTIEAQLSTAKAEIDKLKGTCMCMDCGEIIKTVEQSKHDKKCNKKTKPYRGRKGASEDGNYKQSKRYT